MTRWLAVVVAAGLAVGVGLCEAAEYMYSLPQLLGSPQGEQNLSINLGGEFSSITGARLRIAGSHTPGLLGDLGPSPTTFPYPASIDAYSPAEPFGHSGILGELLPPVASAFEVDEAFHRIRPGGPPDFSTWLDGTANFYFSAGPSAYILIYRAIADPVVNITSATLVVTGERSGAAAAPTADFNGDGTVDGDDLGWWRTAFGSGNLIIWPGVDGDGDGDADGSEFLSWQRQLGTGAIAAATPVPEPLAAALFPLAYAALSIFTRRGALRRKAVAAS